MYLSDYLKSPCSSLSLPYWKSKVIAVPDDIKIVHHNDFNSKLLEDYWDEKYFRLIHRLNDIHNIKLDGFSVKTAELSDVSLIVEIINKSYTDLSVSHEQIAIIHEN